MKVNVKGVIFRRVIIRAGEGMCSGGYMPWNNVCLSVYLSSWVPVCFCVCVFACLNMCVYVCVCECVCVCVCVCINIGDFNKPIYP